MLSFVLNLAKESLSNPIVQALIVGFILVGIGWIVKITKTKKDDAIWAIIKGAAINAFNLAEKAIPDKSGNKTLEKIDLALKEFNTRVAGRLNRGATTDEMETAKDLWSELAFELKKKL